MELHTETNGTYYIGRKRLKRFLIRTIGFNNALNIFPIYTITFSAIFFKMLLRFTGPDAIQYCNGDEGRERHKLYGRCFKDQALTSYYDTFIKVCNVPTLVKQI